jgi:hypothetical protein
MLLLLLRPRLDWVNSTVLKAAKIVSVVAIAAAVSSVVATKAARAASQMEAQSSGDALSRRAFWSCRGKQQNDGLMIWDM